VNSTNTAVTVKQLLDTQYFSVLATRGEPFPYCSIISFSATQDCTHIYFGTARSTAKFSNIIRTPYVSVLIANQQNQIHDTFSARALTALGNAREIAPPERDSCAQQLISRHPSLQQFINSNECALIAIRVSRYILVQNFSDVSEFIPQAD
jgi:nitroimidazol reductase NimA-like FMN-containing flavoprotein (pyridoxamine 5'-phosphate oxidase superfamily)